MRFTKKELNNLKKMKGFNDRLSKKVINDLLATKLPAAELKYHINDILQYGCVSRCVSSLTYLKDTTRFFDNYKKEIFEMLEKPEMIIYYFNPSLWLNQKRYTAEEKNDIAWFIYENIVYRIADYFELH